MRQIQVFFCSRLGLTFWSCSVNNVWVGAMQGCTLSHCCLHLILSLLDVTHGHLIYGLFSRRLTLCFIVFTGEFYAKKMVTLLDTHLICLPDLTDGF